MKKPLNRDALPPPTVDPSGWRLEGVDGQQVWVHYDGKLHKPRHPQNVAEKYHVGLDLDEHDAPTLPKPQTAAAAAINGAKFMARIQVPSTGHWANDYGGPMFLMPGMVIAYYAAERKLHSWQQTEIVRYLRGKQNGDGGWGLHIEGPSCIFGTALTYISLRLLGVPASDRACQR
jgi:lanosterol synthase